MKIRLIALMGLAFFANGCTLFEATQKPIVTKEWRETDYESTDTNASPQDAEVWKDAESRFVKIPENLFKDTTESGGEWGVVMTYTGNYEPEQWASMVLTGFFLAGKNARQNTLIAVRYLDEDKTPVILYVSNSTFVDFVYDRIDSDTFIDSIRKRVITDDPSEKYLKQYVHYDAKDFEYFLPPDVTTGALAIYSQTVENDEDSLFVILSGFYWAYKKIEPKTDTIGVGYKTGDGKLVVYTSESTAFTMFVEGKMTPEEFIRQLDTKTQDAHEEVGDDEGYDEDYVDDEEDGGDDEYDEDYDEEYED